jgi:hypothetical protein
MLQADKMGVKIAEHLLAHVAPLSSSRSHFQCRASRKTWYKDLIVEAIGIV